MNMQVCQSTTSKTIYEFIAYNLQHMQCQVCTKISLLYNLSRVVAF